MDTVEVEVIRIKRKVTKKGVVINKLLFHDPALDKHIGETATLIPNVGCVLVYDKNLQFICRADREV